MNIFVLEFIFPKTFLSKLFSKIFFSKFFFKHFFKNFFPKIFFLNFLFPKFFFQHFFSKIFFSKFFFPTSIQNFLLRALDASQFTEPERTLCICVMKNMISKWLKLDFSLMWVFFGSYCSHHTRRGKFNSFPATHNILLYFFQNMLYLIEVLKCFLGGI